MSVLAGNDIELNIVMSAFPGLSRSLAAGKAALGTPCASRGVVLAGKAHGKVIRCICPGGVFFGSRSTVAMGEPPVTPDRGERAGSDIRLVSRELSKTFRPFQMLRAPMSIGPLGCEGFAPVRLLLQASLRPGSIALPFERRV